MQFYFTLHRSKPQLLADNTALSLDESLSVSIEVEAGDEQLGSVEVDGNGRSIGLVLGHVADLHGELESVDLRDLTLSALVGTSGNGHSVILSDGQRSQLVLLPELLGEGSGHDDPSLIGRGGEVSLSGLSSGARDVWS